MAFSAELLRHWNPPVSLLSVFAVCPLPPQPENGGYICHPRPCRELLTAGSVIEYQCAEGYMLKGDYKYLTCKNGEWKPAMDISCRLNEGQCGRREGVQGSGSFTPGVWHVLPTPQPCALFDFLQLLLL